MGEAFIGKSNPTSKRKVGLTMLEFWQNGKKIEVNPIYDNGKVGQTVIYGERIDWGNINPTIAPLSHYPCPTIFTIVEKKEEGIDKYYVLRDADGNRIKLKYSYSISGAQYLYDAQEWLTWNDMRESEKFSRKQRKIEQLEGHVELLKDILIKQGSRIVTEAQAKDLGI